MKITPSSEALKAAQPKLDQLKKATSGIESIFIKDLLNQMQKSAAKSAFGDMPGSGIYQDLMNQALAESAGKRGMLGIGKMLYEQMAPKVIAQAEAAARLHPGAQTEAAKTQISIKDRKAPEAATEQTALSTTRSIHAH